jgi:membrane protein YqaA with SNARE-associated domain
MSVEHKAILDELIREHVFARQKVKDLQEAARRSSKDAGALKDVIDNIRTLTSFYPAHIQKEDKRFFLPVMKYLEETEKNMMLKDFEEFDRKMIHENHPLQLKISRRPPHDSCPRRLAETSNPFRWIRITYDGPCSGPHPQKSPFALFGTLLWKAPFPGPARRPVDRMCRRPQNVDAGRIYMHAGSVFGALLGYFLAGALETWASGSWPPTTWRPRDSSGPVRQNGFLPSLPPIHAIPYMAFTISAGLFWNPLLTLISASIVGRAGRFFLVAAALRIFGINSRLHRKISTSSPMIFILSSLRHQVIKFGCRDRLQQQGSAGIGGHLFRS